ncbi:TPA: hypothetical protein ACNVM6_001050 [Citrobacter amalonaticus]|uniref:hypothetical protein n=1 Tax=Citrobacter TaxID=544 RepID=UPI00165207FC|nr:MULTISPECIES: hypothetical protein [Citrobacter]MCO4157694.1 hypothetical protein [Citrobacter amalonaticus]MDT7075117.1 hypothetical protein [Citrobacter amalonaticus]
MTITDTNKSVMVGVTSGKEEKAGWRIWLVMGMIRARIFLRDQYLFQHYRVRR